MQGWMVWGVVLREDVVRGWGGGWVRRGVE